MGTGDPTIICTICTNMDVLAEAYEFRCETCGRSVPNPVIALRKRLAAQAETIDTLRVENERLTAGFAELDGKLRSASAGQMDSQQNFISTYAEGMFDAFDSVQQWLRELGLAGGDDVPST